MPDSFSSFVVFFVDLQKIRELQLVGPSQAGRPPHLSAASGLVRVSSTFYVVADDELQLGAFPVSGLTAGTLIRLLPGALPNHRAKRKSAKPDFEALIRLPPHGNHPHGALFALGSGSRMQRRRGAILSIDSRGSVVTPAIVVDASFLFDALEHEIDDVNVEGAAFVGNRFTLFHRGNKRHSLNSTISFEADAVLRSIAGDSTPAKLPILGIEHYDLGDIDGVPLSFTDAAALPNGSIAFSAVAERTSDSYLDGPCTGAAIGVIDPGGTFQRLERLTHPFKIEGIHAEFANGTVRLWLVTDADDPAIPASLLTGTLA